MRSQHLVDPEILTTFEVLPPLNLSLQSLEAVLIDGDIITATKRSADANRIPGVTPGGPLAHAVEERCNARVWQQPCKRPYQFASAAGILARDQLCVIAAVPMQLQLYLSTFHEHHDLLDHRANCREARRRGVTIMGVFAPLLNLADENEPVDQWLELRWEPAALMLLRAGVTRAGRPREEGLDSLAVHLMTPEIESTTHYFFGSAREFRPEDAALNEQIRAGVTAAFTYQDKPVLEARQRSIGGQNLLGLKPVALPGDADALRVRCALDDLLAAESQTQKDAVSETG